MNSDLERKLPHLRQLFNILYGVAIGIYALKFHPVTPADYSAFGAMLFLFVVGMFAIVHAWWRQADRMSTTSLTKKATLYTLVVRFFLIFTLITAAGGPIEGAGTSLAHWVYFFSVLTLLFFVSFLEQYRIMQPLYGKHRVLQRREVWTDFMFFILAMAYTVGFAVNPHVFRGWMGMVGITLAALLVRPLARRLTVWKELPPPHRGGQRARRNTEEAKKRSASSRTVSQKLTSAGTTARSVGEKSTRESRSSTRKERESRTRSSSRSAKTDTSAGGKTSPAAKPASQAATKPKETAEPVELESESSAAESDRTAVKEVQPTAPEPTDDRSGVTETETLPESMKYGRRTRVRPAVIPDEAEDTDELLLPEELQSEGVIAITPDLSSEEHKEKAYGRRPKKRTAEMMQELDEKEEQITSTAEEDSAESRETSGDSNSS